MQGAPLDPDAMPSVPDNVDDDDDEVDVVDDDVAVTGDNDASNGDGDNNDDDTFGVTVRAPLHGSRKRKAAHKQAATSSARKQASAGAESAVPATTTDELRQVRVHVCTHACVSVITPTDGGASTRVGGERGQENETEEIQ
jgi:hypothetical protein